MRSIRQDLEEFRRQLEKGSTRTAYRAVITYLLRLRIHFRNRFAGSTVSGFYQGYLDMSYFALFPSSLKRRNLKIAIVFKYDAFRFEAWLAAGNRRVQRHYWERFKDSRWPNYRVVAPAKGIDSILECDLAPGFDVDDPEALTASIETATARFIADIERFLAEP